MRSMMSRNRMAAAGSPSAPDCSVSVAERTAAIGVRSSWDALATKSRRSDSSRRSSVTSTQHEQQPVVVVPRQRRGVHEQAAGLEARQLDLQRRHARGGPRASSSSASSCAWRTVSMRSLPTASAPEQEHRPQRGVDEHDAAVAIDDDDALLHRLEDAPLQVALRRAARRASWPEPRRQPVERVPELGQLVLPRAGACARPGPPTSCGARLPSARRRPGRSAPPSRWTRGAPRRAPRGSRSAERRCSASRTRPPRPSTPRRGRARRGTAWCGR